MLGANEQYGNIIGPKANKSTDPESNETNANCSNSIRNQLSFRGLNKRVLLQIAEFLPVVYLYLLSNFNIAFVFLWLYLTFVLLLFFNLRRSARYPISYHRDFVLSMGEICILCHTNVDMTLLPRIWITRNLSTNKMDNKIIMIKIANAWYHRNILYWKVKLTSSKIACDFFDFDIKTPLNMANVHFLDFGNIIFARTNLLCQVLNLQVSWCCLFV